MTCSMRVWAASAVAAAALAVTAPTASAELVYGITFDNNLFTFDSASPENIISGVYVSGLHQNEFIQGIDFRPATGELFAVGSANRLHTLDQTSGAATFMGEIEERPAGAGVLNGTCSAWTSTRPSTAFASTAIPTRTCACFRPSAWPSRIPTSFYAAGDAGAGLDPNIVATAYSNNDNDPTTGTTLYSIDSVRDALNVHAGTPGFAEMTTVGALGVQFGDYAGFDISPSGTAYVSWNDASVGTQGARFGTINLTTGNVSGAPVSDIGGGFSSATLRSSCRSPSHRRSVCLR